MPPKSQMRLKLKLQPTVGNNCIVENKYFQTNNQQYKRLQLYYIYCLAIPVIKILKSFQEFEIRSDLTFKSTNKHIPPF